MKQDRTDPDTLSGPCFASVDIRIVNILLVKGFTKATILVHGKVYQPKDLLYKKNIFALRGRFGPLTVTATCLIRQCVHFVRPKRM